MNKALSWLWAGVLLALAPCAANAATITISSNTLWSAITTGSGAGGQPNSSDTITINSGIVLTVNVANGVVGTLNIGTSTNTSGATLAFNNNAVAQVTGTLTIGAGTGNRNGSITMGSGGTLKVGTFTFTNALTWTPGTSLVEITGSPTLNNAVFASFYDLKISSGTTTLGRTITVTNDLTIAGGTLTPGSNTINVGRNFSNSGTFTTGTSTVLFNGTVAQAISGSSTTAFRNLQVTNTSAAVTSSVNFNITNQLNMNGAGTVFTPDAGVVINSAAAAGTLTGSGTVKVTRTAATADFASQYKFSTYTLTNLTVDYAGTAAQTVTARTYTKLTISNSSATVGATGNFNVSGTLTLGTGAVLAPDAAVVVNSATIQGTITGTGTLRVTRTAATAGYSNQYRFSTNTLTDLLVEYIGSGAAQTVSGVTYGSVKINNASGATVASGGTATVGGTLTLTSGTLAVGSATLALNGPTIAGTTTNLSTTSSSNLSFGGSSTGVNVPSTVTALNNLTVNNSNGITLNSGPTINGTLTFTSGNINAGSNTVIIPAAGTVSRTSGHVIGTLQKNVSTGSPSRTFEIGDSSAYAPVTIAFASVTTQGNLTAKTTTSDHPDLSNSLIESQRSVNRYWTVTNSGVVFTTYTATLNYVSGDLDGSTTASNFIVGKADSCNGSIQSCTWTYPTLNGNPNGTSASASGSTSFSHFAVGEYRVASFVIEASGGGVIPTQVRKTPFNFRVTAKDINGNTVTTFTGSVFVDMSSSCGLGGSGGSNFGPFVSGVLDPGSIEIENPGLCTLSATLVGGSASGTSNEFLVSKEGGTVSSFEACEYNASSRCDPGTSNYNRLYTKLSGTAFNLDLVALSSGALSTFASSVTAELRAYTTVQSTVGSDNCPTATPDATVSLGTVTFSAGRPTGAISVGAFSSAYRDVRVKVVCNSTNCSPSGISVCTADNFAVRPPYLSITSSDATQNGSSGTPTIKTGANFSLAAAAVGPSPGYAAVPGYNGTPALVAGNVIGSSTAGVLAGLFGAASATTGIAAGSSFYYSEVGNFGLNADAVVDTGYTSVDQTSDCVASSTSNTLSGGKYGCSIGSLLVPQTTGSSGFGRFIPDNFDVSVSQTPSFNRSCGATTNYIGQLFTYGTTPKITVTARNGTSNGLTNATTANYAGSYAKLTNASLTPNTQGARYTSSGATATLDTSALPAVAGDPTIGSFSGGVATLEFQGGGGLMFTRATEVSPFNASISIGINVIDSDAVQYPGTFSIGPIAFAGSANNFRFGRLFVPNSYGSERLDLTVPVEAQYWDGSKWVRNTADSCSSFAVSNIALGNYTGSLTATNLGTSHLTVNAISSGAGSIKITKPSPTATGSVGLAINLAATSGTVAICSTWTPAIVSPTAANLAHLRGDWCTSSTGYNEDPGVRIDFGVTRGRFIFNRENY